MMGAFIGDIIKDPLSSKVVFGVYAEHLTRVCLPVIIRFVVKLNVAIGSTPDRDRALVRRLEQLEQEFELRLYLDGIGEPDYALWSAGARVVPSLTSRTYTRHLQMWEMSWARPTLAHQLPELALMPEVYPGHCWPMEGSRGTLGVKLARAITPRMITVDHLAKAVSFQHSTAPRDIEIWGIAPKDCRIDGKVPFSTGLELSYKNKLNLHFKHYRSRFIRLGNMTYDVNAPRPTQTFNLWEESEPLSCTFESVLFVFENNWGSSEFTCIYRVRVH